MTQNNKTYSYPEFYSVLTSCYSCTSTDNTLDDNNNNNNEGNNDDKEILALSATAAAVLSASTTTTATTTTTMDTPPIMRRASMSRRQHPEDNSSPLVRSRSQERIVDKETDSTDDTSGSRFDDSERVGKPVNRKTHHRSMSDPFDAQEDAASNKSFEQDEDEDDNGAFLLPTKTTTTTTTTTSAGSAPTATTAAGAAVVVDIMMPTFPRYPVGETRNTNCYSEPPVSIFHVRGPTYFSNSKKVPSAPYLMPARGCDLFLTENKNRVELDDKDHLILGGQLRRKPTLAVNFRFPWGYMCLYFEIPQNLTVYMNNGHNRNRILDNSLSPPERTLAAWLQGDDDYKNDRFKLIPYVAEGPWVVRNMVTGRPAIIGRKLPVSYQLQVSTATEAPLLTATLDIGSSSATAKRIVSVCRRYMSALTVDIGFVIQAQEAAELPEQMLGSIRVHHPDPLKAHKL